MDTLKTGLSSVEILPIHLVVCSIEQYISPAHLLYIRIILKDLMFPLQQSPFATYQVCKYKEELSLLTGVKE